MMRWGIVAQLLQLVVNEVKQGETHCLLVLTEIIKAMTGVEAVIDVSDSQLDEMAGTRLLQRAFLTPVAQVPLVNTSTREANRLLDALSQVTL